MKSTASIDYVDVSPAGETGDDVDTAAPPTPAPLVQDDAASPLLVSADIHAVMLGLWASGLRCVIVYALAPAIGAAGPLAVGTALVIQVAGAAISVSGAHSLWRRRERGYCVYALIAVLACLCAVAALLAPAGS
ncbi:hypothetical protein QU665_00905 [Actinomyces oris]|uniref:Uncharacterized protein n=1 Tax=Actinomyces oris TaxID=544580 RepID=A0AAW9KVK1_9ACTO|nr:hypothetical protein [Actinomyces oris]MEA1303654.1 hypothetical protein [Actinomyces oris]